MLVLKQGSEGVQSYCVHARSMMRWQGQGVSLRKTYLRQLMNKAEDD